MWPVRQVSIIVTSDTLVITRDLVRGLNEAVKRMSTRRFLKTTICLNSAMPVTSPGLQVTLERQLCTRRRGSFRRCWPERTGGADEDDCVPQDEEKRVWRSSRR
jgi:hypothetical protein